MTRIPERKAHFFFFRAQAAFAALAMFLLLLSCCASTPRHAKKRDLIVLLPDASGKTGAIIVSSAGQEVHLSKTGQAVVVEAGFGPSVPFILSETEVASFAGPALKALPPPPKQYILYFAHDSAALTEESQNLLVAVAKTIKENPPLSVRISGHTDTLGDRVYNLRLSYKRALAILDLLATHGVDRSIMEITFHGKEYPLVKTGDQVREPRNRRTEVTVR